MAVRTFIDGTDMTDVVLNGSVTRRLNRPSQASVRIPIQYATGDPGSILRIELDAAIFFHGMVLNISDEADENTGYTQYEATDPMELWTQRPVRDDDGDFSRPDLIATYQTGPQIIEAMLMNTEGDTTAQGNQAISAPAACEGPIFLDFGTFAAGVQDLSGAPTDWPMTMAELASLLVSTGVVDIVITPTNPGGGVLGTVDVYNGDYGTDLSGSVSFEFATGLHNVRSVRQVKDMSQVANKIWYYGGPRQRTPADPEGDQHWCWNIQGQDPEFNPSGGSMAPPGGLSVDANNDPVGPPWTDNPLGEMIYDSRQTYGVRMDIQVFDALSDLCLGEGGVDPERWLYRKLWQAESWLRARPRHLVHITPVRGVGIGDFDIGDLVAVEAGTYMRGGFSGAQRIFEYTVNWDTDGVEEITELQTSPSQEGFS